MAFDPQDGEGAGKSLRKFQMRQSGFGPHAVDVYCTLWSDSHGDFAVHQGNCVTVEGKYTQREGAEGRTFHNISVARIENHTTGQSSSGRKPAVENAVSSDDIPF